MTRHPITEWLEVGEQPLAQAPDPPARPRRYRRVRLLVLAALPWTVLAGAWLGMRTSPGAAAPDEGAEADAAAVAHEAPPAGSDAGTEASPAPEPTSPGPPEGPGRLPASAPGAEGSAHPLDPAEAAGAVLAVREEVTRSGDDPRYVDLALAESAERVGETTVVRVLAVVLHGDEDGWSGSDVRRFAVPLDSAARPLGAPYEVHLDPRPDHAPSWEALGTDTVDEAQILAALEEGGHAVTGIESVRASEEHPGVLRVDLGDDRGRLWLTDEDRPRLLDGGQR